MKKAIILLNVFIVNISLADTSELPTYEQALKLAEAAWKSPPRSIDVTYYITVIDNTRTEEKLLQIYQEAFDNIYGTDEELSGFMLESKEKNIQNSTNNELKRRQDGIKVKYRIRADGKSYRVDRVYEIPDRTVLKATGEKEFRLGEEIEANTPFNETFIETPGATNGFELYKYYHKSKIATIQKIENSRSAVEDRKISNLLKTPNSLMLQMWLGTRKNNSAEEPIDINEVKIEQLCSGTLESCSVEIRPDVNKPDLKERIELSLYYDENKQIYTSLMICDKNDYSKVYYYQTPNPAIGKPPVLTMTFSDYDAQGFPHNVIDTQYDDKGNVYLQETYKIENVRLNIQIPEEVFGFNPPDDYEVTDYRLSEAQRQKAQIENMKKRLLDEDSGRRLQALMMLIEYLKDDPAELKEVAALMLNDERDTIRALALNILRTLLKDNPEGLRDIATSMQYDGSPKVQRMVEKILKQDKSNKE